MRAAAPSLLAILIVSTLGCGGEPASPTEPLPVTEDTHGYFEALAGRPETVATYSLRDPAQLATRENGGYARCNDCPLDVTYDPDTDPDPRRQDAAKVVIPRDAVSLRNQLRLPIPSGADSLFVTWDAWFGAEFDVDNTGIDNYKNFQFASGGGIWTEVRSRFALARNSEFVSKVDIRFYGGFPGPTLGPNVTENAPLSPQLAEFGITPETWTRYWVEFRPSGEWFAFSVWMADIDRDPVLIIDKLLIKPNPNSPVNGWETFWLEYNTSSPYTERATPLVGYARNVVIMRNVTDPTVLLQRPKL